MTRKQLVKAVADLVQGEDVCLSIDCGLEINGRMAWVSAFSADLVDLHLVDNDVSEFEPSRKMIVDCSAICKFNDRIKKACAESDRQAKKAKMDKRLYFDSIMYDADKLNAARE